MSETYDVAIIGGGPAGSTAATFLARDGVNVSVFERERFPRFHIGESLLPFNMDIFERLGIADQLGQHFIEKWGAEFVSSDGQVHHTFHFEDGFVPGKPMSYQVLRSRLDQLLLDTAEAHGAHVFQGHTVVAADPSARTGARLQVRDAGGTVREVRARFLLDASGREGVLSTRCGRRQMDSSLRRAALFAHFENVPRPSGRDAGNIVLILLRDAWFWFIPLAGSATSVGLVLDGQCYRGCGLRPQQAFELAVERCPAAAERLRSAQRVTPIRATSDWSYRSRRIRGDGYLLLGDAAAFVDPIFSSGVYLAMSSGELAASAVMRGLKSGNLFPRSFKRYERTINHHVAMYRNLALRFYRPGFIDVCLSPSKRLRLTPAVISLLAGCTQRRWSLRWRLTFFYWVVRLQRFLPLAPRQILQRVFESPPSASTTGDGMVGNV